MKSLLLQEMDPLFIRTSREAHEHSPLHYPSPGQESARWSSLELSLGRNRARALARTLMAMAESAM